MDRKRALEIANFAAELVNALRLTTDLHKHHYNKQTKKSKHEVIKDCYVDLKNTKAGESVRAGILGYLGYDEEGAGSL